MKKIQNENDYIKVMEEINHLQMKIETPEVNKRLDELYELIEDYEYTLTPVGSTLDKLYARFDKYTEEEHKVYSAMVLKLVEYKKNIAAGIESKKPDFDPELLDNMREWAKLKQQINEAETQNN